MSIRSARSSLDIAVNLCRCHASGQLFDAPDVRSTMALERPGSRYQALADTRQPTIGRPPYRARAAARGTTRRGWLFGRALRWCRERPGAAEGMATTGPCRSRSAPSRWTPGQPALEYPRLRRQHRIAAGRAPPRASAELRRVFWARARPYRSERSDRGEDELRETPVCPIPRRDRR